uniref:Uncharacterized protein n=1 Tax=Corvus moneduloides TaxID=1196302 RepID=A0A8U7MKX6_CORMO
MFSYLIVHHLSLPSLGIRKCSRKVEKRVFILSTTNLLPQDHDAVTKHICQRSTRGGLEAPRCATYLAHLDPLILLSNSKWSTAVPKLLSVPGKVVRIILKKTGYATSTSHNEYWQNRFSSNIC